MGLTWRPEILPVCFCYDRDTLVPFWENLVTGGLFVNPVWNTPQHLSEIPTFEGYLVAYLLPCKHGVKNEGYISVRVTHTTLFHAGVLGSCSVNLLPGVVEIVHKTLNLPEEQ